MNPERNYKSGIGVAAFCALVAACSLFAFYPGLHAYYFLDDFAFITVSRFTENPSVFFFSSHFPGGLFYRPASMLLWWLTVAVDLGPFGQFLVDWLLLLLTSALLGRLLFALKLDRKLSLAAMLAFAVHPVAIMTSQWLSNRFDLLATIGVLVALLGGTYSDGDNKRKFGLWLVAAGTLLAVTSKELGFITPIAMYSLVGGGLLHRLISRQFIISSVVAGIVFLYRHALLPGTEKLLYPNGLLSTLYSGLMVWIDYCARFLMFIPDHPLASLSIFLVVVLLCAATVFGIMRRGIDGNSKRAMLLGLTIMLCAALVQSPTIASTGMRDPTNFAFHADAFFISRFYYLALAGFIIAIGGIVNELIHPSFRSNAVRPRSALVVIIAMTIAIPYCIWQSRNQGFMWRDEARGTNMQMAQQATHSVAIAVGQEQDSGHSCRFYLLNTTGISQIFWPLSDAIVKALLVPEDAQRLGSCYFSTEYTPWYFIMRNSGETSSTASASGSMDSKGVFSKTFEPQTFGSVRYEYLKFDDGEPLKLGEGDHALSYDFAKQVFVDVTERINSGEMVVHLH